MKIRIKYTDGAQKLQKLKQGDWIDLRSGEHVELQKGELKLIHLGVCMELPEGYEAIVAPRSSTAKQFGIIQANSLGIIDESYCGDGDEWGFYAYAIRNTVIEAGDRICQFRIIEHQPEIELVEVERLENADRGGYGSTGRK